jgi:2C-methyl-D-erythritol 2,4-cyclodiphosphate synthase
MRTILSQSLNIPHSHIGLKATTNEGIDGIGFLQAIAAHAVAVVVPVKSSSRL